MDKFEVVLLNEAVEFLQTLDKKSREKVIYNLRKTQKTNDKDLFKKLHGEIWEFRTLYNGLQYRLLAFWDKSNNQNTLVVSTHGIIKKTDKMPDKEIDKAENIRRIYFNQKGK
jgi:phage-related protein